LTGLGGLPFSLFLLIVGLGLLLYPLSLSLLFI
jgi:hypothetical protein